MPIAVDAGCFALAPFFSEPTLAIARDGASIARQDPNRDSMKAAPEGMGQSKPDRLRAVDAARNAYGRCPGGRVGPARLYRRLR